MTRIDHILVLDDDEHMRMVLEATLIDYGYRVTMASRAQEVAGLLQEHVFDGAVFDQHLPDGTAMDLIRTLRTEENDLPVIVLTAHGSIELAVEAIQLGANHFLTKPVDFDSLHEVLTRALKLHHTKSRQASVRRITRNLPPGQTLPSALANTMVKRKRAGQSLNEARLHAELQRKQAELERFIYAASHDLKNPLTTISSYLGVLYEDFAKGDRENILANLERLRNASDQMNKILEDLLNLSSLERPGEVIEEWENVLLSEVAIEIVTLLAGQIVERGGVFMEINPDLGQVYGDRRQITELLFNLVENAIHYVGGTVHPHVEIGCRRNEDGDLIYLIRDNGIGIAPRYHHKVFGLFERLEATGKGPGAGLAVCKRIVEAHGGSIWIESEGQGDGTTVCFTLPLAEEENE